MARSRRGGRGRGYGYGYDAAERDAPELRPFRADLGIHTPFSADFRNLDATYLQILQTAEARGLDIVALTDHNSVGGVGAMRREIEDLSLLEELGRLTDEEAGILAEYRRLHDRLLVLPGFEFTAAYGFHILGIFPPETSVRRLEHVLLLLGITEAQMDGGSALADGTADVLAAYEIIDEYGGLVIPAHANAAHGVAQSGRYGEQTRVAYTQSPLIAALDVTDLDDATRRGSAALYNGSRPDYPRRMHLIQTSDAHRLTREGAYRDGDLGIGDRAMEFSLPERGFAALRSLFFSDDYARARPYAAAPPVSADPILAAREGGATITRAFHEQARSRRSRYRHLLKDIVAFANTNGGVVYVGMSANPAAPVVGVPLVDEAVRGLRDSVTRSINPSLDVAIDVEEAAGKPVIVVRVPKGPDTPYATDAGQVFVRQGGESVIALRDEIVQLVREATGGNAAAAGAGERLWTTPRSTYDPLDEESEADTEPEPPTSRPRRVEESRATMPPMPVAPMTPAAPRAAAPPAVPPVPSPVVPATPPVATSSPVATRPPLREAPITGAITGAITAQPVVGTSPAALPVATRPPLREAPMSGPTVVSPATATPPGTALAPGATRPPLRETPVASAITTQPVTTPAAAPPLVASPVAASPRSPIGGSSRVGGSSQIGRPSPVGTPAPIGAPSPIGASSLIGVPPAAPPRDAAPVATPTVMPRLASPAAPIAPPPVAPAPAPTAAPAVPRTAPPAPVAPEPEPEQAVAAAVAEEGAASAETTDEAASSGRPARRRPPRRRGGRSRRGADGADDADDANGVTQSTEDEAIAADETGDALVAVAAGAASPAPDARATAAPGFGALRPRRGIGETATATASVPDAAPYPVYSLEPPDMPEPFVDLPASASLVAPGSPPSDSPVAQANAAETGPTMTTEAAAAPLVIEATGEEIAAAPPVTDAETPAAPRRRRRAGGRGKGAAAQADADAATDTDGANRAADAVTADVTSAAPPRVATDTPSDMAATLATADATGPMDEAAPPTEPEPSPTGGADTTGATAAEAALPGAGIEILGVSEGADGVRRYHLRDVKTGRELPDATRRSARGQWRQAILAREDRLPAEERIVWLGVYGYGRTVQRDGVSQHDLALRMPDGAVRLFYAVPDDELDAAWRAVLPTV